MRNVKLIIEYDGTNYAGWQRQDNASTIQEKIESVLAQILQEKINVTGAGRTDAGVHARGQVANFRTSTQLTLNEINGGLNSLLPDDIVIRKTEEVALDFHARYSAKQREYIYYITRVPSALLRNYSWYVKYPLDFNLMQQSANAILGTHSFESFCRSNSDVTHYNCNVSLSKWNIDGDKLIYDVSADRFLHGMVRALVGTMVDVGRGYTSYDEFISIISKNDRKEAGVAAPAKGLVLQEVFY
jgi:tRNA pseudouridine38-40 synthase